MRERERERERKKRERESARERERERATRNEFAVVFQSMSQLVGVNDFSPSSEHK